MDSEATCGSPEIEGILFDLDGTLLDSAPDLVGSLNWIRKSEGLSPLPVEEMQYYASRGAVGLLTEGMPGTDEETFEGWRLSFLDHYEKHSYEASSLYQGVEETLAAIEQCPMPWGIVTNKPITSPVPFSSIANFTIDSQRWSVATRFQIASLTPNPSSLPVRKLGTAPERTMYVGDDLRDLEASHAAGSIPCAAVYGYGAGELIRAGGIERYKARQIRRPKDVLAWVQEKKT